MHNNILQKPSWIRAKFPSGEVYNETKNILKELQLNTVCEEASCPNIGECWNKRHATFIIMGSICTRACAFCNIATGKPGALDAEEPLRIARAIDKLKLNHVVITSVDRDDLEDGGSGHFVECIRSIRTLSNGRTTIEILTPDFRKKIFEAVKLADESPDVYNHNIETVPRLYTKIRPGSRYFHSLNLLYKVKERNPDIFTKSGFMLGLGETNDEIIQVLDDLRSANIDFVTIGQYLRPSMKHAPVKRYITPGEFEFYKKVAISKGFLMAASSPLTRSSYHAEDDFKILKQKRLEMNKEKHNLYF